MIIPTVSKLRNSTRRLNRRTASVAQVLAAMREGEALHLQFQNGHRLWLLTGGRIVDARVAALVIDNACVIPVGDALFDGMPGQTWRITDDRED